MRLLYQIIKRVYGKRIRLWEVGMFERQIAKLITLPNEGNYRSDVYIF